MSKFLHIVIEADNILWEQKECGLKSDSCVVKVREGISTELQVMKQGHKRIFIITNKDIETTKTLARDAGLLDYIEDVYGTEMQGQFMSWPDIIRRFCHNQMYRNGLNINSSNTLMILSSEKSIRAAQHQGFLVVGSLSDETIFHKLMKTDANAVAPGPEISSDVVAARENLRKKVVSSASKLETLQHA